MKMGVEKTEFFSKWTKMSQPRTRFWQHTRKLSQVYGTHKTKAKFAPRAAQMFTVAL